MISRRLLLKLSAAIGALLTFNGSAVGELLFVRPLRKERPRVPIDPFTTEGKALVGVSGTGSVEERVRAAVALIGGFRKLTPKVRQYLNDPRTERLFSFQAMYAGLSPQDALAIYAIIAYMDSVAGVYFPKGGMHALPRGPDREGGSAGSVGRSTSATQAFDSCPAELIE